MESSLADIHFAHRYRTGSSNSLREFYRSALSCSTEYNRAAGYFSSSSLALIAGELEDFAARGGQMRLVASPRLSEEDAEQLRSGYEIRDVLQNSILRDLGEVRDTEVLGGLGYLAKLVATDVLHVKLAFIHERDAYGMYHEKLGYLRDSLGNSVAFSGSANETASGILANFESIDVFRSWEEPDRVHYIATDFDDLWNDRTALLRVVDFPEVARETLERVRQEYGETPYRPPSADFHFPPPTVATSTMEGHLSLPHDFALRDYQEKARKAWLKAGGRGMLEMATGTGKTLTALSCAAQISRVINDGDSPLTVVIAAPYVHLVDQWAEDVRRFGLTPILAYESRSRWIADFSSSLSMANLGRPTTSVVVTTNATLTGQAFQQALERVRWPLLFIGDEAHNFGSPNLLRALPANAKYRLGLSATPDRWYDAEGTEALVEYFGPVVFQMSLDDAMKAGALCPYKYYPRVVELTDDEFAMYQELSGQIAVLIAHSPESIDDSDSPLGMLLRRRASILGHASRKLDTLKADINSMRSEWRQLIYCAEGRPPSFDDSPNLEPRQIDQVVDLVGNTLGLTVHPYVSETPRPERRELLRRFDSGDDLRFLAAMKCLDEGVDIPDARVGYILASSSNPRQFIQRRGRLLRRAPGKSHAVIFDYLAVPPQPEPGKGIADVERNLMTRELSRADEFARSSDNYADALAILGPLKERYHLRHL